MTPADILAIAILTAAGLYIAYRVIKWAAERVIDGISTLTRYER